MTIKHWPRDERPREKLLRDGPAALSDAELLALFLGSGVPGRSAVDLARSMLSQAGSLRRLLRLSRTDFCRFAGIGPAKYAGVQAALEVGRRSLRESLNQGALINNPQASRDYLSLCLRDKPHETFYALFLDSKHRIIHHQELFRGTIDRATVPVREVVKDALRHNAAAMIVAHNHPSGIAEPSHADKALTINMLQALDLVGVRLLDHLVVGDGDVISLAEMGVI